MDREMFRTCSADQAGILSAAAGRFARVGSAWVCIHEPANVDLAAVGLRDRFRVRIELLDQGSDAGAQASPAAARVLTDLFGSYLA